MLEGEGLRLQKGLHPQAGLLVGDSFEGDSFEGRQVQGETGLRGDRFEGRQFLEAFK